MAAISTPSQNMEAMKRVTIVQLCPQLNFGGVERGVIDVACFLQQNGYQSIVISNGGSFLAKLQAHGVQHIQLPIHSKNPITFLLNLRRLKKIIRSLDPDLLLPYSRIPTWLIYLLQKKLKLPFISHCLGTHSMGSGKLKRAYNTVLMQGNRVVANSQFTRAHFLNYYQEPPSKIRVIPCSLDTEFFDPDSVSIDDISLLRAKWRVPAGQTVLLLPARLSNGKGHEFLIHTLKLFKEQKINNFYAVILGNTKNKSTYYKKLRTLIDEFGLSQQVFFAGDCCQMNHAYAAADIVLSISTRPEAFGLTVIEAQAMGKLVIASRHGGSLETIKDEVTGFLVEPNNALDLASTLIRISEMDNSLKRKITAQGKKSALNYSKDNICSQLIELYKELIAYHRL